MEYEQIKELIAIFEDTDLNDMEVQLDNAVLRLNRGSVSPWTNTGSVEKVQTPTTQQTTAMQRTESAGDESSSDQDLSFTADTGKAIKSPIVGTFYQSASPEDAPFVKVGDTIAKGDVVCIIEAMKFMNEVNSEVSGTITEILVNDGDFVEYGQELFRVK